VAPHLSPTKTVFRAGAGEIFTRKVAISRLFRGPESETTSLERHPRLVPEYLPRAHAGCLRRARRSTGLRYAAGTCPGTRCTLFAPPFAQVSCEPRLTPKSYERRKVWATHSRLVNHRRGASAHCARCLARNPFGARRQQFTVRHRSARRLPLTSRTVPRQSSCFYASPTSGHRVIRRDPVTLMVPPALPVRCAHECAVHAGVYGVRRGLSLHDVCSHAVPVSCYFFLLVSAPPPRTPRAVGPM